MAAIDRMLAALFGDPRPEERIIEENIRLRRHIRTLEKELRAMKDSSTHTTASGTITVHKANTTDEALGMLRNLAEAAKHAPIEERVDWECDEDGYGTATLDGEEVARIIPYERGYGGPDWLVRLNGIYAEGDCTDADDGYRKVVAMLRFLEGWEQDNG